MFGKKTMQNYYSVCGIKTSLTSSLKCQGRKMIEITMKTSSTAPSFQQIFKFCIIDRVECTLQCMRYAYCADDILRCLSLEARVDS